MPDAAPAAPSLVPATAIDAAAGTPCLQCGTALRGPYCHVCGQHVSVAERVTFRSLWTDFRVRRLNLDRGFFRTVLDVVVRPGTVARAFVEGRRQTYTHPITLLFVAYAGYALVITALSGPLDAMLQAQLAGQLPPPTASDPEAAEAARAITEAIAASIQTVVAYGAYFAVLVVVPFGFATRWLLADRGRTVAEGAVLAAYVEAAVVLPSMLVFTPLAALSGRYWLTSVPLALYLGYAAWGGYQFFDRTAASAALSAFSMVLSLIVYFGLLMAVAVGYGVVVAVRMHGGG